jgi:hypothetical protein
MAMVAIVMVGAAIVGYFGGAVAIVALAGTFTAVAAVIYALRS